MDKYFKSYSNMNAIGLFGMGSYQIWSCHVTQVKNLSFSYLKSYCPLNFRTGHQILWFCCIPNGSYKEGNLKAGRICPPSCGIGLTHEKICSALKAIKKVKPVSYLFSLVLTSISRLKYGPWIPLANM